MLIDKNIEVTVIGKTLDYYCNLGYHVPTYLDSRNVERVKRGTKIIIKCSDLPPFSSILVDVECDYCHKKYQIPYAQYYKTIEKYGDVACKECQFEHIRFTNQTKYGVNHVAQLEEVKQKIMNTCIERYGVTTTLKTKEVREKTLNTMIEKYGCDHPMHSEEIKKQVFETNIEKYNSKSPLGNKEIQQKIKNTNTERYGVFNPMQNKTILEKAQSTLMSNYGVEHPTQNDEIKYRVVQTNKERYNANHFMQTEYGKEKFKKSFIDKYGVDNPMKIPYVKNKVLQSFYSNGNGPSSKNQRYLCTLFGGELNYPVNGYMIDIYNTQDNICCEYDGGGHTLRVKFGEITQSEFEDLEIKREKQLMSLEYNRIIRIITPNDYLPEKEKLIEIYNLSKKLFLSGKHIVKFYINDGYYDVDGNTYDFNFGLLHNRNGGN